MVKSHILVAAVILYAISAVSAYATCSVTNTFTNGTTADATQVNQNFTDVLACINALPAETDGTWTPTDASGAGLTFSAANGFYRKVGNVVFIWGFITYPSTANGSQAVIGSLPFAVANLGTNGYPGINVQVTSQSTDLAGFANKNATTFSLISAGGTSFTNASTSAKNVYFAGTYAAN